VSHKAPTPWLLGLLLIAGMTTLLVHGIHTTYMRPDENLVYDFTNRSLPDLVRFLVERDVHPPVWFSSFWLWRQVAGDSEFVARVYTVLLSMLTLALVYQVGRKWWGAPRYGWIAILLLGVNTFFYIHALEIRPYGLNMLLATTSMWTFQRWLTRRTWRSALYYALTLPALLYVHYFMFVLILAQALFWLIYWLTRTSGRGLLLRQAGGVALVAGLLWLPWLPAAINQIVNLRMSDMAGGNARGLIGSGATTVPTDLSAVRRLVLLATNGLWPVYGGLLVLSVMLWWRKHTLWLAMIWAIGVPVLSLALNTLLAVYLPRYVVYLIIGLALVVAAALGRLPRLARWPLVLALVLISWWLLPTQFPRDRIPYRLVFEQVSEVAQPGDVLFFNRGGITNGFVRAQARRYLALWDQQVETLEAAQALRRVWLVNNDEWFTDATRADFAALEQTHPLQQVIGQCDRDWCYLLQLMEAAPNPEPVLFGDTLAFWGADVTHADDAVQVRLWWTASQTPPLDYSVGIHLLDAEGRLVAQADSALVDQYTGELIQTSQMQPEKIYIDVRRLNLPSELPAGPYELRLVVYQSWDNTRLRLPGGADYWVLNRFEIS
jgi:4-amino-4-deoxy-L-arabinose transferase-like glycosyltransferase